MMPLPPAIKTYVAEDGGLPVEVRKFSDSRLQESIDRVVNSAASVGPGHGTAIFDVAAADGSITAVVFVKTRSQWSLLTGFERRILDPAPGITKRVTDDRWTAQLRKSF